MSANLETMNDSGEAAKVAIMNIPTLGSRAERRENRYDFFTSEKNRMTNQVVSRF